ncbi:MAG: T9SS type A sorting domain-containing protein [Bacteroidales bacterium]|nr:T9SS type A sorting domain-containing protein [Bacteroidales bacterium]
MKKLLFLFAALTTTIQNFGQQNFTDFQEASLVIGQPNFQSWLVNSSDSVIYGPASSAVSAKGMLAVAEQFGGSVKIWYTIPETNGKPADVVVGNPGFTEKHNGPTREYAESFDGVAWSPDGKKLIATCGSQNRVLIWNSVPQKNGQPADVVLGQPDFTSTTPGTLSTTLDYPCGVMVSPSGKLLVSDYYNNRVLIWNAIPTVNGAPADVVIGQPTFNNKISGNKANQLYRPRGVYMAPDGRLLIACSSSHHIFVYDSIPVTNNESASVVIGQEDFKLSTSGTSDSTMYLPYETAVTNDGKLAIAEYGNNRVLLYDSLPRSHGACANNVLGQKDFFSNMNFPPSGKPDNNNFSRVYGVTTDINGRLFITGRDMHRVMVFGHLPAGIADLSVAIIAEDTAFCELSHVLYRVNVYNAGPDTAYNVLTATAFPYEITSENYSTINGSYNKNSGCWKISSIAPGSNATLLLEGHVNPGTAGQKMETFAAITGSSAIDKNMTDNGTVLKARIYPLVLTDKPVVNDISVCSGTSALLSAKGNDELLWYTGEDDLNPVATGPVFITDTLTEETTFYVEARNICAASSKVPVHVDIIPVYHTEITATVCSGDDYMFPDGYLLQNITGPVSHTSVFTSVYGCDSTIFTTLLVNTAYMISETVTVCSGESYEFPDGLVRDIITLPFVYTSHLTAVSGCDSIIETRVMVNTIDASVFQDGAYFKATMSDASYQWIESDNGSSVIPGETGQDFTATRNGIYAVIINKDGCTKTSDNYYVTIQGIGDYGLENSIRAFPNPVNDKITLDFPASFGHVQIQIVNMRNEVESTYSFSNVQKSVELNMDKIGPGIHLMKINADNNATVLKIIKE